MDKILSIVIPVYNVEKYIRESLESIIGSSDDNIEVIVVNDGSTDCSLEICKEYEQRYGYINVISQENKGLSEARNTGIRNANGEYILFLDSDDFIKEGTLVDIINRIKNDNKDFYLGRAFQYFEDNNSLMLCQIDYNTINYRNPNQYFIDLHKINHFWFAAWIVVINRKFLIDNDLFFKAGIYHEDELWVPSVFIKAKNMGFLNFGFYCYRMEREGSIVASPKIKREFDKLIVADELDKIKNKDYISNLLIKDRQASIVFGILLSYCQFKGNPQLDNLRIEVKKHLHMLKQGKYYFVYWTCKIFGINTICNIFKYF